jgi:uncharacterized protein YndB with AHSA1/START domain
MGHGTIDKSIEIDAPAATVWEVLTDKGQFLEWTKVFNPGGASIMEGEFAPDAGVSFKDQDGTGLKGKVVDFTPAQSIRIEYVAEYFQGVESSDASREGSWIGSAEAYSVTEHEGRSTLHIHQTLPASDVSHFDQAWDRALDRIKELAE